MDPRIEVELARRFLVDGWQSFAKIPGDSWGIETVERHGDSIHDPWQTLPDRIIAAAPHLQGISGHERRLDELRAQGLSLLEALEMIDQEFG